MPIVCDVALQSLAQVFPATHVLNCAENHSTDGLSSSLFSITVDIVLPFVSHLLTYAHRSQWSIGHQRPPAIALCSGLLLSFRTSWSPAVSALLQCLASNYCEAGLSSSSLAGSRSGLGVWCWMPASWGCVRSSPTSSAVSAWPLVLVPLAPTVLQFGSSLAIGFCRWPQPFVSAIVQNLHSRNDEIFA